MNDELGISLYMQTTFLQNCGTWGKPFCLDVITFGCDCDGLTCWNGTRPNMEPCIDTGIDLSFHTYHTRIDRSLTAM